MALRTHRLSSTKSTGANTANGAIAKKSIRCLGMTDKRCAVYVRTPSASAEPKNPVNMNQIDLPMVAV